MDFRQTHSLDKAQGIDFKNTLDQMAYVRVRNVHFPYFRTSRISRKVRAETGGRNENRGDYLNNSVKEGGIVGIIA